MPLEIVMREDTQTKFSDLKFGDIFVFAVNRDIPCMRTKDYTRTEPCASYTKLNVGENYIAGDVDSPVILLNGKLILERIM